MVENIEKIKYIDSDHVSKTCKAVNNSLDIIEKFDEKSHQRDGLNDQNSISREELNKYNEEVFVDYEGTQDNGKLEVEVELLNSNTTVKREPLESDIKEGDAIILEERLFILKRSKEKDKFKPRMIYSHLIRAIYRERFLIANIKRDKLLKPLNLANKYHYRFNNFKGRNDSIINNLRKPRKIFNFKSIRKKKKA